MNSSHTKVAVGLSGGVDSSVAAALLKQSGYVVTGITMEIFDGSIAVEETARHACYGPGEEDDVTAATAVCEKLAIPYSVIDLRREYRDHVIDYFRNEYLAGRTPNPCIVCNRRLKFGFLLEKAKAAGIDFEYFATGHYARIEKDEGRFLLRRAADGDKDQTYFLYGLTQQQLAHTIFPLGTHTKDRVREIAHSLGLETAYRLESQDFIAGRDYTPLFADGEIRQGDIVDVNGCLLGKHRGIIHYTIGQRRGLGIASDRPLYVMDIDAEKNRIIVGEKKNLYAKGLIASDLNFLAVASLDRSYEVKARIRLRHTAAAANLHPYRNDKVKVLFKEPQAAVTPGQSVVFYRGDTVFGGGIIEKAI
jgi:tRNA-specific 2-thiouridylase